MLMARSGHTSVRLLAKYARMSAEALARHQAGRDRHGGGRTAGGGVRHCWEQPGSQPAGRS